MLLLLSNTTRCNRAVARVNNNTNPLIDVQPGKPGENIVTINAPKGIKSYTAPVKGPSSGGILKSSIINNGKAVQLTTFRTNFNIQLFGTRNLYMTINKGWRISDLIGVRRVY